MWILLLLGCGGEPTPVASVSEAGPAQVDGLRWTAHVVEGRALDEVTAAGRSALEGVEARAATRFEAAERQHREAGDAVAAALTEGREPDAAAVDALVEADAALRAVAVDATVEAFEALGPSANAAYAPAARGMALGRGMVDRMVRGHSGAPLPGVEGEVGEDAAAVAVDDLRRAGRLDVALVRYYEAVGGIDGSRKDAGEALRAAVAGVDPALRADLRERIALGARLLRATPADGRFPLLATPGFRKWVDALAGEDAFPEAFGLVVPTGPGLEGPGGGWGPPAEGAPKPDAGAAPAAGETRGGEPG